MKTATRTNTTTGGKEKKNKCNNIVIPYVSGVSEYRYDLDHNTCIRIEISHQEEKEGVVKAWQLSEMAAEQ